MSDSKRKPAPKRRVERTATDKRAAEEIAAEREAEVKELLTPELLREFREAFSLFVRDSEEGGERSIATEDLTDLLLLLGMGQSEDEIAQLVLEVDEDGSGTIDEREFIILMAALMREQDTENEIIEAFRPIDERGDGRCTINSMYDEVLEGFGVGPDQFREYVLSIMSEAADGTIDYSAFVRRMLMRK